MKYKELVKLYQALESTTKKLKKIEILSNFLKEADKEDLASVVYLVQGNVYPQSSSEKIGMSSRLILKVIAISTGNNEKTIEDLWRKKGDLGKVASELISKKSQHTLTRHDLTLSKVIENLRKLSTLQGQGTVNKKIGLVAELLSNADPDESKFIVNTVLETLRIGVAEGIINDSIAKAFDKDPKEIKKSYDLTGDYGEVALNTKTGNLDYSKINIGRPLKVMLGPKVENVNEAFEALGKPIQAEFKLDGFRLQIHKKNDEIKLFTRSLEDVTKQFPDVINYIKTHIKGKNFILDAEAVGYNPKTGKYLPFQAISQRIKRKYDIDIIAKAYPVEVNVFDVLSYESKTLINNVLKERRALLEKIIKQEKGKIILTKKLISDDEKELIRFYKESLNSGNEGLMLKNLNSIYKPGRYVDGWVKLKSVLEPLDLVIVKAEWGEGKRSNWLSSYTVACKNGKDFLEVGKVSTGLKEKTEGLTFNQLTKELRPLIIEQEGRQVNVKPKIIVEVAYEEIQKSPTYDSGYALRFPRILRLRDDKGLDDINTFNDIEMYYKKQKKT